MAEPAQTLLLFGATGDLSRRMLLPSLFGLHADGLLPADLQIASRARMRGYPQWRWHLDEGVPRTHQQQWRCGAA